MGYRKVFVKSKLDFYWPKMAKTVGITTSKTEILV